MNDIELECFVKVAENQSFIKASEKLNMSQPTVSKQIRALEKELNAKLFNRSTRKVELTAMGERFLLEAKNILRDIEHAHNQVASFRNNASYSVRIGYTEVTELPHMSVAFRNMRREYRNVYPTLRLGMIMDNLVKLEQGALDGVLGLKDISFDAGKIEFHELSNTRLVLAVSSSHPLYKRESVNMSELKHFAQVLYIPDHRRKTYINNEQHEMAEEIYITSSIAETYAFVSAGMGYALIPSCYVSQDQSISAIPIQDSEVVQYGIYMHKGMMFPALRTFASFYNEALMKGKRI